MRLISLLCFAASMFAGHSAQAIDFEKGIEILSISHAALSGEKEQIQITLTDNGTPQTLIDDDGFATLLVYQRDLAARIQDGSMTADSSLPQPSRPLKKSLEMLEKMYVKVVAQAKGINAEFAAKAEERLKKIRTLKMLFNDGNRTVGFIQSSGLEDFLNEAQGDHSYTVISNGKEVPGTFTAQEALFRKDGPTSISKTPVSRSFRKTKLDWKAVTAQFEPPVPADDSMAGTWTDPKQGHDGGSRSGKGSSGSK